MSSSEGYEIAPDVGLVISMAENKMCWKDALCEYVDNAFDADATNVLIEIGANAKHLLIRDNGHGADDIPGFLITGKHTNKRAKLGRYGVGLKEASLYLGGENSKLCIYTTKNGKTRGVRLDWHKLVKSGRWFIPPEWVDGEHPAAPGAVGTEIVVAPVARRPLEGKEWDRLLEELGYTYTPAILKGWQILVKSKLRGSVPVPLQPFVFKDDLEQGYVDTPIEVNGKKAHVIVGIVKDGVRVRKHGITYTYRWRVVEPASSKGCGDFSIGRIAGIVRLDDNWQLTKNKNGISHEAEELYEAVFDACKDLLKRAECAAQLLESAAFLSDAADIVGNALFGQPNAKEKRDRGDSSGTAEPTGKGKKRLRGKKEQDGQTLRRGVSGRIKIELTKMEDDADGYGWFDGTSTVFLSEDHPRFVKARKDGDRLCVAEHAMALVCAWIVAHPEDRNGQRCLVGMDGGDPSKMFSRLMAKGLANFAMNGTTIVGGPRPTSPSPPDFIAPGSDEKN